MMRPKQRQMLIRQMISHLLASDYSPRELADIADELAQGDVFREIAQYLGFFASQISRTDFSDNIFSYEGDREVVEALLEIIQKRRIKKQEVIDIMKAISPNSVLGSIRNDMTLRQILSQFALNSSEADTKTFYTLLLHPEESDPYLSGIMRRK